MIYNTLYMTILFVYRLYLQFWSFRPFPYIYVLNQISLKIIINYNIQWKNLCMHGPFSLYFVFAFNLKIIYISHVNVCFSNIDKLTVSILLSIVIMFRYYIFILFSFLLCLNLTFSFFFFNLKIGYFWST